MRLIITLMMIKELENVYTHTLTAFYLKVYIVFIMSLYSEFLRSFNEFTEYRVICFRSFRFVYEFSFP